MHNVCLWSVCALHYSLCKAFICRGPNVIYRRSWIQVGISLLLALLAGLGPRLATAANGQDSQRGRTGVPEWVLPLASGVQRQIKNPYFAKSASGMSIRPGESMG